MAGQHFPKSGGENSGSPVCPVAGLLAGDLLLLVVPKTTKQADKILTPDTTPHLLLKGSFFSGESCLPRRLSSLTTGGGVITRAD